MSNYNELKSYPGKFVVRMPIELREEIRELAKKNRRSMNSEILYALEKYLQKRK